MKTRTKVAIITALVAIPALLLGPVIFPPADVGVEPTASQVPFFVFHLPLEIAGVALAYCAFSLFRGWRSGKLAEAIQTENEALTEGMPR